MVDLESIPEVTRNRIAAISSADAVIGLTNCTTTADLRSAAEAARLARSSAPPLRTLILYPDTFGDDPIGDGTLAEDASVAMAPLPAWRSDHPADGFALDALSTHTIAAVGHSLGCRACLVWSSPAASIAPATIRSYLQAIDDERFDLAVPRYTPVKFGSLVNGGIIAPLTRTLYGQRIPYPMAQDFCFSPRLAEELLRTDPKTGRPAVPRWIPAHAASRNLRLCLVELDVHPPSALPGLGDLSSVLAAILSSLFQDAEKNASFWQRTRGSQALPKFGAPGRPAEEPGSFEVQSMIDGFSLAYQNLVEIWGLVLPPATMLELKKLTRASSASFRLADATWARVVFDFVLAQRQRVMNRDHLLRALTPIYLAWVASYAIEIGSASAAQAAARLDQLAQAFELQKPYLLSRWRWPDRFNP